LEKLKELKIIGVYSFINKTIKFLLILGTVSLIYFDKITIDGELSFSSIGYRSDFVFLFAVLLAIIIAIIRLGNNNVIQIFKTEKYILISLAGIFLFSIVATILSSYIYKLNFDQTGFANFSKLILGVILSIITYVYLKNDRIFFNRLAISLYIPPLLPLILAILFFISPRYFQLLFGDINFITGNYSFLDESNFGRFVGLTSNPFQVAMGNIVAISFLWPLAIYGISKMKIGILFFSIIFMVCQLFSLGLTSVRSSILSLVFIFSWGAFATRNILKKGKIIAIIFIIIICAIVFIGLPSVTKEIYSQRFIEDSRTDIWRYFISVSLDNPLGIGFNYEQQFAYKTPYLDPDRPNRADFPPHNVILVTWMYGGIGALISLILCMFVVKKSITNKLKYVNYLGDTISISDVYYIGAVSAFISLWIMSIFTGLILSEYIQSIVFAMAMAGSNPRNKLIHVK